MDSPQLALLEGRGRFLGLDLELSPGVLVPRAETELLARTALGLLTRVAIDEPYIVDMCAGSGNLATAIAVHVPQARVWASDLTEPCVQTVRRNVARHALESRVTVVQGDLFEPMRGLGLEGRIDLVVCNPPYISTRKLETDRAELLLHEPREAFDAGPYGLSIHQRVVADAAAFLKPGGWLACEFGVGQAKQVKILFDRTRRYESVELVCDATGAERVAVGRLRA